MINKNKLAPSEPYFSGLKWAALVGVGVLALTRAGDTSAVDNQRLNLQTSGNGIPVPSLESKTLRSTSRLLVPGSAPLSGPNPDEEGVEIRSSNPQERDELKRLYSHAMCDGERDSIIVSNVDEFPIRGSREPSNSYMYALGATEDKRDEGGKIEVTHLSRKGMDRYYTFMASGTFPQGIVSTEFLGIYLDNPQRVSNLRAKEVKAHEMAHACGKEKTNVTSLWSKLRDKLGLSPQTSRVASRIEQVGFSFTLRTKYGNEEVVNGLEEIIPTTLGRLAMMGENPRLARELMPTIRYEVEPIDVSMELDLDDQTLMGRLRQIKDRGSLDELVEFSTDSIVKAAKRQGKTISQEDAENQAWEHLREAVNP